MTLYQYETTAGKKGTANSQTLLAVMQALEPEEYILIGPASQADQMDHLMTSVRRNPGIHAFLRQQVSRV